MSLVRVQLGEPKFGATPFGVALFVFVRGFLTDVVCVDYKVSLDNEDDVVCVDYKVSLDNEDDAAYTEKKYFQEELT